MKKNVWKKLIGKESTGIIVTILTFVIVFGAIFAVSNLTLAKDTLPGIVDVRNDIAKPDSEFRVLEIVPGIELAEFGYLVGGEEPLDKNPLETNKLYDSTNREWNTWQEYLAANVETMDEADRQLYIEQLVVNNEEYIIRKPLDDPSTTDDDAVVELFNTTTKYTKPMWYESYYETGVTPETADGVLQGGNTPVYGWLESDTSGGIGWNAMFTSVTGKTYNELVAETTPYYIVDTVDAYGQVAIVADDITNSTYPDHYYTYKKDPSKNYYIPAVTFGELKADVNDGGLVDTGEDTDDIGNYYIVKFKMLVEGDWTADAGPVVYEASNFAYLDAKAPYIIDNQTTKGHNLTKPAKNIYFKGGLFSNEMFKCYSLDIDADAVANHNVNVHTVTPGELNAMHNSGELATYLSTVDFIYLNAGENTAGGLKSYVPGTNDLLPAVLKAIFEKVCNEKAPCIVDNHLIDLKSIDGSGNISNTYAYALTCMLMQSDYRSLHTDGDFATYINANLATWATNIQSTIINSYNYVNGNVMVINSTLTDNKLTDYYNDFSNPYIFEDENGDIDDSISADVLAAYKIVWDEIKLENLYRAADQTSGYAALDTNVYKGTVVRYIINYANARVIETKTAIEVLEIQPGNVNQPGDSEEVYERGDIELRPSRIRTWLGVGDDVEVHITTMNTIEFIGTIEDLNSEYDLIYIGADIYGLTRTHGGPTYTTDYKEDDNYTTMDGLIYTNVGGLTSVNSQLTGHLESDWEVKYSQVKNNVLSRYNGNDITADKHNALVDYVKGTYPIVVSDKLCTDGDAPTSTTVDNCTYLYSFLEKHLPAANVFKASEVEDGKNANFKFYANRAKLSIGTKTVVGEETSVTEGTAFVQPGSYKAEGDTTKKQVTYISKEDDHYYLNYKFTITNNGAVYANTRYTAALYLDSNSDGKFSVQYEKISDIILTHVASGKNVTNGELISGEQYTLRRQVPENFSGLLTWKVEVSQTTNEHIRDSITGYTRLADTPFVKIKVLQVRRDGGEPLILADAIGDGPDTGDNDTLNALVWGGYCEKDDTNYEGISDEYEFEFTTITNAEFNTKYEDETLNLMSYDMVVLGFYDSYDVRHGAESDINEAAVTGAGGLREYIDSGKSVLFAHDTTSVTIVPDYKAVTVKDNTGNLYNASGGGANVWGYYLNTYIRDMVGLDTYGITLKTKGGIDYTKVKSGEDLSTTDEGKTLMNALKNELDSDGYYKIGLKPLAYLPNSNKSQTVPETQGFLYGWMDYNWTADDTTYRNFKSTYNTYNADKVNEGPITTYPYYLDEHISIARTHHQYFTLDLFTDDDKDGETDLVVWYTMGGVDGDGITGDFNTTSHKDVMNSYYIYNKGNITYTGFGDFDTSDSRKAATVVDECKLFVNTLVAAYNASIKEPQVIVYESEDNLTPTTTFYEYGDETNDVAFRADGQRMYFSVSDMNVIRGSKVAQAEYYVKLKTGTTNSTHTATVNGVSQTYEVYSDGTGNSYIRLTDLKTYNKNTGQEVAANDLKCGEVYYVDIPSHVFSEIDGVKGQNTNTFMVAAKTVLTQTGSVSGEELEPKVTSTNYNKVDFVHVELFPLD